MNGGRAREARVEEVARLVSGMAHGLRNSLQAVAINLEVVRARLRRDAPELADELDRFAAAADDNVRRLGRRVDLLIAAAHRGPEEESAVDLAGLAREVAEALELDRRPPRVEVDAPDDERGVRLRRGAAVVLLGRALESARAAARGEESVRAEVRYAGDEASLEVPVAVTGPEAWEGVADDAGARAGVAGDESDASLILRFSRA
ncbi:MAG: histidine kinase dimerization/phospho-acceptor domain-containing protein [Candidatus Palauibacterales bacterium]|nr:histidine kinase dimerization/phospho-acceptor domain-containing protein [Candidatus Palauibacterales bacterium]MDP2530697.1 histidine kinase dimerization/phospho-acceptor domain-containing protein [Candidatus Palauibacterales bacterium]